MDANLSTLLVAVVSVVVAPLILAVFRYFEKRQDWKRQDEVAKRAEQVRRTLVATTASNDVKFAALQKTADGTHTIVNNQRTVLLRLNAELRERIARENPDDADAQAAAESARSEADKADAAQ